MNRISLQIKFRCLCFFVSDTRDPLLPRVHVLMPDTTGHCATGDQSGCVDRHVVRLIYPKLGGRLDANGYFTTISGKPGVSDFLEMEEWAMVLGEGQGGAKVAFPRELVDISPNAGRVDPALVGSRRHPNVISRITLEGGEVAAHDAVATWLFNGQRLDIAQEVLWTIPLLEGDRLEWQRTLLTPPGQEAKATDVQDLTPLMKNANGIVRLEVHHVTECDFGKEPDDREPEVSSAHFAAYYTLFSHVSNTDRPVFVRKKDSRPRTCMGASGRLS